MQSLKRFTARESNRILGLTGQPFWQDESYDRQVRNEREFVRNVSGIDFYNDSKATSVDATLKALDAFPGGLWVILGGKDKGLDYSPLRAPLQAKARAALLIGAAAAKIAGHLQGAVPLVDSRSEEHTSELQ